MKIVECLCFFRFIVTVSDRPGGISDLCKLMASVGVSIKDIMHERAFIRDIYSVEVRQSICFGVYGLIERFYYS